MAKNSNKIKSKSTADRIFGAAVILLEHRGFHCDRIPSLVHRDCLDQ